MTVVRLLLPRAGSAVGTAPSPSGSPPMAAAC